LKAFGFLDNSARGVWALTESGTHFLADEQFTPEQLDDQLQGMNAAHIKAQRADRAARGEVQVETNEVQEAPEEGGAEKPASTDWKERLIATLTSSESTVRGFSQPTMSAPR
jgi:hypothetical protein